jgi:hypothetical protein
MERFFIENNYLAAQPDLLHKVAKYNGTGLRAGKFQQFANRLALHIAELLVAYGTKLQDRCRQSINVSVQRTNS